jgi:esterase/lipase superfamily enzyme
MHRSYHRWFSPTLGRDMEMLLFGHAGAPVLVFPTSQGRFYEFEDRGMVGTLSEQLEQGWIQLICVDSIDSESFYCRWAHPGGRIWMDGYNDDNVYFNNPVDYTANLYDRGQIHQLQQQDIILVTGQTDPNRWTNDQLSTNLWRADVGHAYRVWDGWAHDWPYWHQMIRTYIGGHD